MSEIMQIMYKIFWILMYVIVQLVTRGGDWAIQNYIIYNFEGWLVFIHAVVLGAMFNISAGYILQKVVVFPRRASHPTPVIRKQFGTFVILRAVFGATAFLTLTVLYIFWPDHYWIYSGVITLLMWLLTYQSQRDIFTGRLNQLPRVVRRIRVSLFQLPKKTKRLVQTIICLKSKRVHS